TPSLGLPPSEFRGTARYQVDRVLSSGQHAVVYGGRDVVRDRAVALKVVRAGNAEAVVRLKREHRVAGEIRHPNLARVDDLLEVQGELVLVMELVDGEPLLEHVAGSQDRLASALGQLVGALDALHARRLAHCDVKPQNVLVEQGGRVVLLDCGLASPWGARRVAEGTTAYMAPEALEGAVGPERDFYALGVVLHEALTGKLPSRTSRRKRSRAAARPDRAGPLRDLCSRLLDPAPSSRATAADVVRVVGAPARLRSLPEVFVGRRDELAVLSGALAAAARGRPATVWIEGTSGMGKTALLDRFCRVLEDEGRALVLRGRAREETSAPYPALDHAIEDLGTHLNRLPAGVAERIVPEHDRGLTQLFPVLARVPAIARAKRVAGVDPDLIQVHRRAADALHDLLRRLAQRAPLVLVVDDLQWLDRDSASLLVHLLGGGEPAAVLFVGAVRTDGADAGSADLETLEAKLATPIWRVPLGPLSIDESAALLRERWRRQASLDESTAVRLARRSGGSPFFVDVLASESGSAT
ncbi:MAG TPA: serine/threonine-protein kinase, partial [Polyangiaceae bacterium]|nr:serine/threonine-protein kinase [Polyangiaceae bacterium]